MKIYPYAIDNGHLEQVTFTGITHGVDGDRLVGEGCAQPGAAAPMHVHYLQDETFRVIAGPPGAPGDGSGAAGLRPGRGRRVARRHGPQVVERRRRGVAHGRCDCSAAELRVLLEHDLRVGQAARWTPGDLRCRLRRDAVSNRARDGRGARVRAPLHSANGLPRRTRIRRVPQVQRCSASDSGRVSCLWRDPHDA